MENQPAAPAFDLTYADLPALFHTAIAPQPAPAPILVRLNEPLARELGLDAGWLRSPEGLAVLSGGAAPAGVAPIAMAYSGHQFGGWSPLLGDGRAALMGEFLGPDGRRYDLHLKGAGATVYSRGGDGKATLGSVVREYIVSEAMAGLGIPTTRALGLVATGETVYREWRQPGAVLPRIALGHVRVGTFQLAAAAGDTDAARALADYVIGRNYPEISADDPRRFVILLEKAAARQARLIAQWMLVGFIHGVMNTDNMSLSGETIDFGPCAFMDDFHPAKTFSSIDRHGRYAWDRQPNIALWNLTRFAETLLPLIDEDAERAKTLAEEALSGFGPLFARTFFDGLAAKLGLADAGESDGEGEGEAGAGGDRDFLSGTLNVIAEGGADFTLFFRRLTEVAAGAPEDGLLALFADDDGARQRFTEWLPDWRARFGERDGEEADRISSMRAANPIFIARNHRVEQAIAAANEGDFGPFDRLCDALRRPFDEQPEKADLENAPTPDEVVQETFCGT